MNRKIFILAVMLLPLLGIRSEAAQIALKPQVSVNLPDVKLSDVVTSVQDLPDGALDMIVTSAPALGQSRELSRQMVENALRSAMGNREISWQGADSCVIQRPCRLMDVKELAGIIETQLKSSTGGIGTVHVTELDDTQSFAVPVVKTSPELEINPSTMNAEWSSATLRFSEDGQTLLMKTLRFHWSWKQLVYQAIRPMQAKERINLAEFKQVSVNVFDLNGKAVMGKLEPGAFVLTRPLIPGTILTEDCIRPRTLVHRGEIVKVIYQGSCFSVSMTGTALQDGSRGQTIGVLNPTSSKRILAKIADEGVLEYVQ